MAAALASESRPAIVTCRSVRRSARAEVGRGWAVLADDGSLRGHLYFHLGDDSGFRAVRVGEESEIARSARQAP